MATISVADFSAFINQQIRAQEKIEMCLWRLESLLTVAVITEDFYTLSKNRLHNYFSIAGDLIDEATKANQMSLNELLKQKGGH